MKHFDIKRGEWPSTAHAPAQRITENVAAQSVALLGSDMPGLRPRFVVNEGAQVTQGQTIFTDRRRSEIVFVAPISGTVKQLAYGPRKT
ncbi:MAG: NADH:ubiquinone reductase (Na(+)-transporting) subunit A, partial [Alphaproteobacteria bacterium]|nr:NADH:ubiquinone reductase (Na(+)-transporting) subunit A [Alphaproteobacteria bacterium]